VILASARAGSEITADLLRSFFHLVYSAQILFLIFKRPLLA